MKLELSRVQIRATVGYVSVKAVPTYVKATAFVYLDDRGLNKYARDYIDPLDVLKYAIDKLLQDEVIPADAMARAVGKLLESSTGTSDATSLAVGFIRQYSEIASVTDAPYIRTEKGLEDSHTPQDQITSLGVTKLIIDDAFLQDLADVNSGDGLEYSFGKGLSEFISTPSDAAVTNTGKGLSESISLAETVTQIINKVLADIATIDEQIYQSFTKGTISDAVTSADSFDRTVSFDRTQDDTVTNSDSSTLTTGKSLAETSTLSEQARLDFATSFTDAVTNSDANTLSFDKYTSDAATLSDAESHVVAFVRQFDDAASGLDAQTISTAKSLSDTQDVDDSGSLRMTDYWDITYCSEDYVGSSRTFT